MCEIIHLALIVHSSAFVIIPAMLPNQGLARGVSTQVTWGLTWQ